LAILVRGKGYLRGLDDLGKIVVKVDNGTPVLLRDVARIELGPDERRGITELNGEGEAASGITLQRFGLNALDVIDNVKKRIAELTASVPKGTDVIPVYDRSNLICATIFGVSCEIPMCRTDLAKSSKLLVPLWAEHLCRLNPS
jgi:Cu(I)/Ag(I) efflux system membrane protein CusA/SilA